MFIHAAKVWSISIVAWRSDAATVAWIGQHPTRGGPSLEQGLESFSCASMMVMDSRRTFVIWLLHRLEPRKHWHPADGGSGDGLQKFPLD
jgi:hypothetical protein